MRRKFLIEYTDTNGIRRKTAISADNPEQAEKYFTVRYPGYTIMDVDEYVCSTDDYPEIEIPCGWKPEKGI